MMTTLIALGAFCAGGLLGVLTMCLMVVASTADDEIERVQR